MRNVVRDEGTMSQNKLPEGFVVLTRIAPHLAIDLKYAGSDNLVGRPLEGYAADSVAVITEIAAQSLHKLSQHLQKASVKSTLKLTDPTLLIWDAYRPQMACDDFWQWSLTSCEKNKCQYYPNLNKKDLFKLGYIATESSHSRGSTADLTLVDRINGKMIALDMGTGFDYMDPLSGADCHQVPLEAYQRRQFLKQLMQEFGWNPYPQEWWHFTYADEPFPDTYFNFPVLKYEE